MPRPSSQLWLRNTFDVYKSSLGTDKNGDLPNVTEMGFRVDFDDFFFDVLIDAKVSNFSLQSDLPGPVFIALSFLAARQRKSFTGRNVAVAKTKLFVFLIKTT